MFPVAQFRHKGSPPVWGRCTCHTFFCNLYSTDYYWAGATKPGLEHCCLFGFPSLSIGRQGVGATNSAIDKPDLSQDLKKTSLFLSLLLFSLLLTPLRFHFVSQTFDVAYLLRPRSLETRHEAQATLCPFLLVSCLFRPSNTCAAHLNSGVERKAQCPSRFLTFLSLVNQTDIRHRICPSKRKSALSGRFQ